MKKPAKKWLRALGIGAGVLAFATAFIGFLHTSAGRPLMSAVFGASCPALFANATSVDNGRRMSVARERGAAPAPARPALGFVLERTTQSEIAEWAKRNGVTCDAEKAWMTRCTNVDSRLLDGAAETGHVEELTFGFRDNGKLVNVATLRRGLTPSDGNRIEGILTASLNRGLGGSSTAARNGIVTNKNLSSSRVSVRYSDYFADIVALNLPTSGVAVREQYLSAVD